MMFATLRKRYEKLFRQFFLYTVVGLGATLLNIFLMWLAVDKEGFNTLIATSTITVFIFFGKYFTYILVRLIHPDLKKFFFLNATASILTIIFTTILIDLFHLSAVISSAAVTCIIFLLRFASFKKAGLIRESASQPATRGKAKKNDL